MKQFLSLVLSLVMFLNLSISPAAAENNITSTDSGSNTASQSVTASYTPDPTSMLSEAKWGASAESLTESGTLAEAFQAAKENSSIKYIQLQKDITAADPYDVEGCQLTLDLNGKTLTGPSGGSTLYLYKSGELVSDVTFKDSSTGGKIVGTEYYSAVSMEDGSKATFLSGSYQGGDGALEVYNGTATIQGGEFSGGTYAVRNLTDGTLNIQGGTFNTGSNGTLRTQGALTIEDGIFQSGFDIDGGSVVVKGGTFTADSLGHFEYWSGTLDLSAYDGTSALTDLRVYNRTDGVSVGAATVKLPEGYGFYDCNDEEKKIVTVLNEGTTYGIIASSSVTYSVTVAENIENGTVTVDKTSAEVGETVTLTVSPADGYQLSALTVTYGTSNTVVTTTAGENGTYTFRMPDGNVSIRAEFESTADLKEAVWGTSKDSLTSSGTLEAAIAAAAEDSSIKYIQLCKDITATNGYYMKGCELTLDLNGKTIAASGMNSSLLFLDKNSNGTVSNVTFTDSSSGGTIKVSDSSYSAIYIDDGSRAVFEGGSYQAKANVILVNSGSAAINGGSFTASSETALLVMEDSTATINDGSFSASDNNAWGRNRGSITVNGGSFTGSLSAELGTATIKGGSFTAGSSGHFQYFDGTLDLSGYAGTTLLTDLIVYNDVANLAVSAEKIKLPADYGFYRYGDENKEIVTTLQEGTKYMLISSGGSAENAVITEVEFILGSTTYKSGDTVTVYPDSGIITVRVKGTNFAKLDGDKNKIVLADNTSGTEKVEMSISSSSWSVDTENNTAQLSMDANYFDVIDSADGFQITYTNDGSKYENSGITVKYSRKAIIESVRISIDGNTYTYGNTTSLNPAKIKPTSTVRISVQGTDLDLGRADNVVEWKSGQYCALNEDGWTLENNNSRATKTFSASDFESQSEAFELRFSNKGKESGSFTNSGIYIIYALKAEITGMEVKVGDVTYTSGNVTLTAGSGAVTLIAKGNYMINADEKNEVNYINDSTTALKGWEYDAENGYRYITIQVSVFAGLTEAFQLRYTNDAGSNWTDSGIYLSYQADITSVDINWGSMSFTYSDEQVNGVDKGWICENETVDKVTVKNSGTVSVKAEVKFEKNSAIENITKVTGAFDSTSATLAGEEEKIFTLTLSGKPDSSLDGVTIGTITVTITKPAE